MWRDTPIAKEPTGRLRTILAPVTLTGTSRPHAVFLQDLGASFSKLRNREPRRRVPGCSREDVLHEKMAYTRLSPWVRLFVRSSQTLNGILGPIIPHSGNQIMSDSVNAKDTLDSYITDMLALEEHIAKAIDAQVADLRKENSDFAGILSDVAATTARHIGALQALKTSRHIDSGGMVAEAVKRAGSIVAGLGAAAVDLLRSEKLPKNLRDDYTAYSLASIGYQMLLTTAISLGDDEVAGHARTHFTNYAKVVADLSQSIPGAVIEELRNQGLTVIPEAAEKALAPLFGGQAVAIETLHTDDKVLQYSSDVEGAMA